MRFGKARLGALGLILGGVARIFAALAGGDGDKLTGIWEGGTAVATGVGVWGVRDKQDRSSPEPSKQLGLGLDR